LQFPVHPAPDSLRWESLGRDYSDFLRFLFVGDLARFYAAARWEDWEKDTAALSLDDGFSICPPPWTAEGKQSERPSRKAVPMSELVGLHFDMAVPLARP
jgi:hypothetical protein